MATKKTSSRPGRGSSGGPSASASASSARSTVSGPARKDRAPGRPVTRAGREDGRDQALAAAMPFNPNKAGEYGKAACDPQPGATAKPASPPVTGSTLTEAQAPRPKAGAGKPEPRLQSRQPAARSRARRLVGPRADHQPGRAGRGQPELAEGGPARAGAARGLHPPREDHPLRSRAHPRAHRPCARLGGPRLLRVLRADDRRDARVAVRRGGQAHAGVRPLLDRDR